MRERHKYAEGKSEKEKLQSIVTPMAARFAYTDAGSPIPANLTLEMLRQRTTRNLNYVRAETTSNMSRASHWTKEGQPKTFAGRVAQWHTGIKGWLDQQNVTDETVVQALQSLDINVKHDGKYVRMTKQFGNEQVQIYEEIEKFRVKYFAVERDGENTGSDIKKFVHDVAEGCRSADSIDLVLLRERIDALSGLLPAFGNDAAVIIENLLLAYGMLDQKGSNKEIVTEAGLAALQQAVTSEQEKRILTSVGLPTETPPAPTSIPRPETPPPLNERRMSDEKIQEAIEAAKTTAFSTEELKQRENTEAEEINKFVGGAITVDQLHQALLEKEKGRMVFDTIDDFKRGLELCRSVTFIKDEEIKELVEHEGQHFTMAQGFDQKYNHQVAPRLFIRLSKDQAEVWHVHPSTAWNDPTGIEPDELRQMYIEIISAPIQLNDKYSRLDRKMLEGLLAESETAPANEEETP